MPDKKFHILIIDDEADIAMMVKTRLENEGYHVDTASSAEEGLNLVHKGLRPDLFVLDVMLPGMSGYELCSSLKINENLDTPVIMLTSRIQFIDEKLGYLCKADSYIRKPLCGKLLIPEVKRLLNGEKAAK